MGMRELLLQGNQIFKIQETIASNDACLLCFLSVIMSSETNIQAKVTDDISQITMSSQFPR